VRECVEEAVAPTRALLTKFDELSMRLGEEMSPAEMERVLDEQANSRMRSTPPGPGSYSSQQ
jgi:hypothetical protein